MRYSVLCTSPDVESVCTSLALFIQVLWKISYTNRLPLRALAFVTHSYTASSQLVMTPQTNSITHNPNSDQAKAPASVGSSRGLNVQEELQQLRNGEIQRNRSRQQQGQQQRAARSSHVEATTVCGNSYPTSSNFGAAIGTSSSSSSR
jgi:hypothetical protein